MLEKTYGYVGPVSPKCVLADLDAVTKRLTATVGLWPAVEAQTSRHWVRLDMGLVLSDLTLQIGDLSPPGELAGEEITLQGFPFCGSRMWSRMWRTCEGTYLPCLPASTPVPCPQASQARGTGAHKMGSQQCQR